MTECVDGEDVVQAMADATRALKGLLAAARPPAGDADRGMVRHAKPL